MASLIPRKRRQPGLSVRGWTGCSARRPRQKASPLHNDSSIYWFSDIAWRYCNWLQAQSEAVSNRLFPQRHYWLRLFETLFQPVEWVKRGVSVEQRLFSFKYPVWKGVDISLIQPDWNLISVQYPDTKRSVFKISLYQYWTLTKFLIGLINAFSHGLGIRRKNGSYYVPTFLVARKKGIII